MDKLDSLDQLYREYVQILYYIRTLDGYRLDKVYALEQHCGFAEEDPIDLDEDHDDPSHHPMYFSWDWYPEENRRFSIYLTIELRPTDFNQQRVEVAVVGAFASNDEPLRKLEHFIVGPALMLLYTHASQLISTLTSHSSHGPILQPLTYSELNKLFIFADKEGTKKLRENPTLAASFRVTFDDTEDEKRPSKRAKKRTTK